MSQNSFDRSVSGPTILYLRINAKLKKNVAWLFYIYRVNLDKSWKGDLACRNARIYRIYMLTNGEIIIIMK